MLEGRTTPMTTGADRDSFVASRTLVLRGCCVSNLSVQLFIRSDRSQTAHSARGREGGNQDLFFYMAGPCTTTEHSCWGMPQTATELAIPGPKPCESKGGLLFACNVRPESEGGFRTKQGGNKHVVSPLGSLCCLSLSGRQKRRGWTEPTQHEL